LKDIAVNDDGSFSQSGKVNGCPEAATDEPLNFNGATILSPNPRFPFVAGVSCSWNHPIFGGNPASVRAFQEIGNAV
jgi:hypothetical protein